MKKHTFLGLFLCLIVFILYLFTGYGTIAPFRDSGDLASAAFSLGISHPPGYVLYVLMGKVFSVCIPWGNAAYRLNIMSMIFGVLAVFFLYRVLLLFTGEYAALVGAVCFALMPALWRLSQVTEMYSINVFFCVFILWWFLKEDNPVKLVWMGALLCGLGLTNHQTLMFFFPGYLYIVWKKFPRMFNLRHNYNIVLFSLCFVLLGLAVYAFLPIRSMTEPIMDSGNPETIRNFFRMIFRSDYGLLKLHPEESVLSWNMAGIVRQIIFFSHTLLDQFSLVGILAGLIGLCYAWKKNIFGMLFLLFIVSGPGFTLLANLPVEDVTSLPILEPNVLMPGLVWALCIGLCVQSLWKNKNVLLRRISPLLSIGLITTAVIGSTAHGVYNRDNFLAFDYGKNIFRSVKPESILYNPDDPTTFITEYLKMAHESRHDIKTIIYFRTLWGYHRLKKLYPAIMPAGEQDNAHIFLEKFFKKNTGTIPIYADFPFKFPEEFKTAPNGIVYRLLKEGETITQRSLDISGDMFRFYSFRPFGRIRARDSFFSRQIVSYYTAAHNNTAIALLQYNQFNRAREQYFKALCLNPYFKEGWSNLGALEYRLNNNDSAEQYFTRALQLSVNNPEDMYNMGLVLKKKKEYDRALDIFARIPADVKYNAYALNESGLIHIARNRYDKAITDFKTAITYNPAYTLPYYNLGLAYQKKGDIQHAVNAYQSYCDRTDDLTERTETKNLIEQLKTLE